MLTWLCRIMIFIFTFQIFTPQMAQAGDTYRKVQEGVSAGKDAQFAQKLQELNNEYQTWRQNLLTNNQFDLNNPEDAETFHTFFEVPELQRQEMLKILWFDRIFLDGRHAKLWEKYHTPALNINRLRDKDVCQLYSAITDLHLESDWLNKVESQIRTKQTALENQRKLNEAYNYAQMGDLRPLSNLQREQIASILNSPYMLKQTAFKANIENGNITLDELIDALDPWRPGDVNLNNVTIAGEILGNSLDVWEHEIAANREAVAANTNNEEIWDEEMFWQETDDFLLKLQLRAMYRLSQLKPISYMKSDANNIEAAGTIYILLQKIRNFYQRQNRQNPLQTKRYSCEGTPSLDNSVSSPYNENAVSSVFYDQVRHFANTSFTTDDVEYQNFLLILDYAIAFEITRGFMGNIELYVKLLNAPLNKNKYQQRLSPALELLFLTWYENVRYNNNQEGFSGAEVFKAFSQFTDKEQYALPTRIFALEIIGHLVRIQNEDPIQKWLQQNPQFKSLLKSQRYNNYTIPDAHRQYYSGLAADIYCSLVSTNGYRMKSYGLDASQMQLLANKLAWIYNDFYDITTPQISTPGSPSRAPTASCHITTKTPLNPLKQKKEMDNKILMFTAEAVFWIYGGEIFSLVGRAFRIARAATLSLPRAIKASAMANRGRKALSFSIEVQKGVRMSNLSQNLTRNGVQIAATRSSREVTERGLVGATARGAGSSSAVETVNLTSNHALRNQYSFWNPRRWVGQRPGQVLEYQVAQQTPGFGLNIGRVNGNLLPNGIRSYKDLRIFRNNLFDATGRRMQLNTYSFAEQHLLRSEALVLGSVEKMGKNGMFDLWIPSQGGGYINLRSLATKEEATELLTSYMANPAEEIFLTQSMPHFTPAVQTLSGMSGIRVSLPELVSGMWKNKVAREIYTPLDWGGTVSNLLMPRYIPNHMPLFQAPGKMIAGTFNSSSFVSGLKGTTKFFLGMEVLDRAVYPSFLSWQTSVATDEQQQLMNPYADILAPNLIREDEQASQETLDILQQQGFNTDPIEPMYDDIMAAANPQKEGSTLSFPLIAAWHYSSKLPFISWDTPFQREGDRITVNIQARKLERSRMLRHYQDAKDSRALDEAVQNILSSIRQEKAQLPVLFNSLKQIFPGDWRAEEQAMTSYYQEYAAEVQEAAQISNIREKNKQLEKIVNKYNNQAKNWDKRLDNKARSIAAPEGESAFFRSLIEPLETHRNEFRLRMFNPVWTATYPDMAESFSTEYAQLLSNTIAQIKDIKKQHISFIDKYSKMGQIFNSLDQQSLQLAEKYKVNQFEQHNSSAPAAAYDDMIPQN